MAHTCPWWGGYFIDNWLRRRLHDPTKIVGPYVKPGMTVMDVGCGMGLFSLAMAKMTGDNGRVIAVDLQQNMLDVLRKRAEKAGVAGRIRLHQCEKDRLGIEEPIDFALAMMMIHEVPDRQRLLSEIHGCLKPGGKLLAAEPKIHVSRKAFGQMMTAAEGLGFRTVAEPKVHGCQAVVLEK